MAPLNFIERDMSEAEFTRMREGFDEHAIQHGNPVETEERFGFVALDKDHFVGCSSALAYKHDSGYSNWCLLTDLFVESPYRTNRTGAKLLQLLEEKIQSLGIKYMYTWTGGYEAPEFYKKQGYQVFAELPNWYRSGHARIGLWKCLMRQEAS